MINSSYFLEKGWRLGVGICLINEKKKIFLGERIDNKGAWQMPQGGVDIKNNETLLAAAKRELYEETGVSNVNFLLESKNWHYYHLPNYIKKKLWSARFIGQKQKWFAFSLINEEEINLKANPKPEFSSWKWVYPEEIIKEIVSFKKEIYENVLQDFNSLF